VISPAPFQSPMARLRRVLLAPVIDLHRVKAVTPLPQLVLLAAVALVIQGCGDSLESPSRPGYVSRDDLGKAWPLTVDAGVLNCLDHGDVTFTANGTLYAVTALAPGDDIDSILADAPGGEKKELHPLVLRGRKLCAKLDG
jgi:hypothetical protein